MADISSKTTNLCDLSVDLRVVQGNVVGLKCLLEGKVIRVYG